ncbi:MULTISPECIES: hypothetical protein [unclassified Bradyrhizobium]|uniref:hypothetical protein n=1 Tax=unclassified Bradyrhizobium TaxID=2631580 RepID=UPI002FF1F8EE
MSKITKQLDDARVALEAAKAKLTDVQKGGRFGKQDFVYLPEEDAYRCPAGEQLPYRFTSEEDGKRIRRYASVVIFTDGNHLMVLSSDDTVGAFQ